MSKYNWKEDVKQWFLKPSEKPKSRPRKISHLVDDYLVFFDRAFANTYNPEQSWFGTHSRSISLVVGGIFLAALNYQGEDKGIWLLADREPTQVQGLEYRIVTSTENSEKPLTWVHADSFDFASRIIGIDEIWQLYAIASERVFDFPIAYKRNDEYQLKFGKRRLNEFLPQSSEQIQVYFNRIEREVSNSQKLTQKERKSRLHQAPKIPDRIKVTQTVFNRNPDVIAEVLGRANGICEECKNPSPFLRASGGTPYLEVHHRKPLAEGGEDTVENAIALCPNCHRKAHYG